MRMQNVCVGPGGANRGYECDLEGSAVNKILNIEIMWERSGVMSILYTKGKKLLNIIQYFYIVLAHITYLNLNAWQIYCNLQPILHILLAPTIILNIVSCIQCMCGLQTGITSNKHHNP